MPKSTDEENAAYRKGLCIRCKKKPYSAGRPRCNDCHYKHTNGYTEPLPDGVENPPR